MQSEVSPNRLYARVPFEKLGSFSRLFRDYCDGAPGAVSFFGSHFGNASDIQQALDRTRSRSFQRDVIADVLLEQNEKWNASPATMENIERFRKAETCCVVTGQQLGLFVSPLYTIYKSLTAIKLASSWSSEDGDVVPIFWLAGEDHDLAEIRSTVLPTPNGLVEISYPPSAEAKVNDTPTGRLTLDARVAAVVDTLEDALPSSVDAAEIISAVRNAYTPGRSFADAFATLLHKLLPDTGIVVLSADDDRLKSIVAPVMATVVTESDQLHEQLELVSGKPQKDYHAQVQLRNPNLFSMRDNRRIAIDRTESGFNSRLKNYEQSRSELVAEIEDHPESFSPNVVLRPVVQDVLLPNVAYVGGPGEVAYFAQLRPVYEMAGIEMPIIYPRASLSLLDGNAVRFLQAYDKTVADLHSRSEALFAEIVKSGMKLDVDELFAKVSSALDSIADEVLEGAGDVDKTLERSAESARTIAKKGFERVKKKIVRAEKRKHAELEERIFRTQNMLFPNGAPQERVLSPLYFAARYGADFYVRLLDDIDLDTTDHQVLRTF